MMFPNPELQRQIWLELSPMRIIMMPLVIAAVYYLGYLNADGTAEWMEISRRLSMIMFAILAVAWGSKQVAESVSREVSGGTWTFQRMTALHPAELALGKMIGAAVYPWYGGGICLAGLLATGAVLNDTAICLKVAAVMVSGTLMCHALFLSASILGLRKSDRPRRGGGISWLGGALLLFLIGLLISLGSFKEIYPDGGGQDFLWYTVRLPFLDLLLISMVVFMAWSLAGLFDSMRRELYLDHNPAVWPGFLLFCMVYFSGFTANLTELQLIERVLAGLLISFSISGGFSYVMVFSEPKDPVMFKRLIAGWRQGDWAVIRRLTPAWLTALVLSLLVWGIMVVTLQAVPVLVRKPDIDISGVWCTAVLAFMIRDLSLVLLMSLMVRRDRADASAMVFLLIGYLLIPMILNFGEMEGLLPIFLPLPDSTLLNGVLPVVVQAAVLVVLVVRRWRIRSGRGRQGS